MGTFILLFTILTIIFLISFIKLINDDDSSNKIKIIIGVIMFIIFIFCTTGMLKIAIYNTNSVTEIINDYKSNKIKEVIIIENQDTTYKYKY